MFGYVRVNKGELLVREYEAYRGVYCSVCRALGKRYGPAARLLLSYDSAFLAMVRCGAADVTPAFRPGRCPFNPAKRCNYCTNADEALDFVCAAVVLMFYYRLRDTVADAPVLKKLAAFLLLPFALLLRRKAKRKFAWMDALLFETMQKQTALEKAGETSVDKAAHPSADALGKLFSSGTGEREAALYRFGYFVGRWVYLIDAADDLKDDLRHGSFNVFANAFGLKDAALTDAQQEAVTAALNESSARAIDALNESGLTVMKPILENILYDGMQIATENLGKGSETK